MSLITEELIHLISIDRLDAAIIGALARRRGIAEIAAELGVTRNTVQSRIRRLEESGALTGFTPRVDLPSMGIAVEAFAALALEQGYLDAVVEALTSQPNVLEVHATTGREDLLVRLAATSLAELQTIIQRIVGLPGVAHSDTSVSLTTPLPHRVQPLLDHVTRDAGFGRSTPAHH